MLFQALVLLSAVVQIASDCFPISGAILDAEEIFRSTLSDSDCCEICQFVDACNTWSRCVAQDGCRVGQTSVQFQECIFYFSEEVSIGEALEVVSFSSDETGEFEHGYLPLVTNKNGIDFIMTNDGQSVSDVLPSISEATKFNDLTKSSNIDAFLQSDLDDPDLSAIICIPSDSAFDSFFDDTGISSSNLEGDPDALNTLVKQNIIAGKQSMPQEVGKVSSVPSLLDNSTIDLSVTTDGGILVKSAGLPEPANKISHVDLSPQLTTWTLDKVLLPENLTVKTSAIGQSKVEFVSQQPGMSVMKKALSSDMLADDIKKRVNEKFGAGTLYAPVDATFNQFFNQSGITEEEFLQDEVLLNQVIESVLVDNQPFSMSYGETDDDHLSVFQADSSQPKQTKRTLEAELGEESFVIFVSLTISLDA